MADEPAKKPAMAPRTRAIYENCRVLDIGGALLFRAGQRRLDWYLARGLARRLDTHTIQLTFANKGTGRRDEPFYLQDMRNECAVCGSEDALTMHHVVPHQYRQHMEEAIKSRSSHDLLPVCISCHDRYEAHAAGYKQHLAQCFAAPLQGTGWITRKDVGRARRAAAALLSRSAGNIPPARVDELRAVIDEVACHNSNLFGPHASACIAECQARGGGGAWASAAVLDELLAMESQTKGPDYRSHGEIVVDAVSQRRVLDTMCAVCSAVAAGGTAALTTAWRQHFVEHACPAHLPDHWDVGYPCALPADGGGSGGPRAGGAPH